MKEKRPEDLLLEGDRELYEYIEEQIAEKRTALEGINSRAWEVIKNTINKAIERTHKAMTMPDNLQFKCGQLNAFSQMLEWATRMEKDLRLLEDTRAELLKGE